MHLAAKDELGFGRNTVAVADLEEHLIEARKLAAGLLVQFCGQHMGELRIGEALHRNMVPDFRRRLCRLDRAERFVGRLSWRKN